MTRSPKKKRGFSLIEMLLVVTLIVAMGLLQLRKLKSDTEEAQAKAAGQEIAAASESMTLYAKRNIPALQAMADPNCAPVAGFANICELSLNALNTSGAAPPGWSGMNHAIGSPYKAYFRRVASTPTPAGPGDFNLESLIFTEQGWLVGGTGAPQLSLLGSAARHAGAVGGVINGGEGRGLSSGWELPAGSFPNMADAQLAASAQLQGQALGAHLPVNGSRAMTGDLNLNGFRLNNVQDIMVNGNGMKGQNISSAMPNWVLKGVYGVADFDADNAGGTVPIPMCPDSANGAGSARVLVSMQALYNEQFGGYATGLPGQDPNAAVASLEGARGAWNFYALEDSANGVWRTYIRRYYDNGYIPGEGLAAVYCYYP